jgi:MFS family permease
MGSAGTACGMVIAGWMIHYMREDLKWNVIRSYRAVFWGYAGVGVIKFLLAMSLSKAVEAEKKVVPTTDPETAPLLGDGTEDEEPKKKSFLRSLLPKISAESKVIVLNLVLLFALDSFASGLAAL